MITQLYPPLTVDNVDIIAFDANSRHIHTVFHIYGEPVLPNLRTNMKSSVRKAVRYMELEGFLPPKMVWTINTGVILHPSKNK